MNTANHAALELCDIRHSYALDGQMVPVLHGINLRVEHGQMVAIQGPSGSGKSTLLYIMGCLLKTQEGKMYIDGVDVTRFSSDRLATFRGMALGFVFQQFHLLPKATVLQNILLSTTYAGDTSKTQKELLQKARDLAALVGLGDRLDHLPNQLSGGQQQRVAIARALMNDPAIVLADEPTGNLDSISSAQIIELLRDLNRQGRTIIMITHDPEVAAKCDLSYHIRDGKMVKTTHHESQRPNDLNLKPRSWTNASHPRLSAATLVRLAAENLSRNRIRSALTMLGITIGIAAVLSMITLGDFTKRKILDSYADLGVNTVSFRGNVNWDLKASDRIGLVFRSFDPAKDLDPLPRIFSEVVNFSPLVRMRDVQSAFAGKTLDSTSDLIGVNQDGIMLLNREISRGVGINPYQVEQRSPVCVIGEEIVEQFFRDIEPIGETIHLSKDENVFGCRVTGILKPITSSRDRSNPNRLVILPYTYLQSNAKNWWSSLISEVLLKIDSGVDIENSSKKIRSFFEQKYGRSGRFRVDSDSVLVAQMNKFLNLFTILLGAIALVTLSVGGIGITNMMLVSVSERLREIGLRKALGATDDQIQNQFLVESLILCAIAGVVGMVAGFAGYQALIFGASRVVAKLPFEWVFHLPAILLSAIAIFVVGLVSGYFPAARAQKLQVIEALRSD